MAWTTSGNLREFFGPRDLSASRFSSGAVLPTGQIGRHLRRLAVIGLATAHLVLLGELATTPPAVDSTLATAAPAFGHSLPWLTITGLMLAIVWLARDWPVATADAPKATHAAPDNAAAPAVFGQLARTISTQRTADPMTGLLARVSHDLRTPLNAVMGFSDLMQREAFGPLGDARYQSYARHIHVSSIELLKAAEDTLAMTSLVAAPQATASEAANLHDLIAEAFTTALIGTSTRDPCAANAPPVMLALAIAPQLQINCERRALRQALINLISAAIGKVTAQGSARTVHVAAVTNDDVICLTISVTLDRMLAGAELKTPASSWNSAEDLPICLARALLELQGLAVTLKASDSRWSAQVLLEAVSQSDFFSG